MSIRLLYIVSHACHCEGIIPHIELFAYVGVKIEDGLVFFLPSYCINVLSYFFGSILGPFTPKQAFEVLHDNYCPI